MRNITNDTFFDDIDSEIKAYLLGFFIADGCVSKDEKNENRKAVRLSVNLSEKDREIVELFQQYICPNNKIIVTNYRKGAVDRKPVNSVKWSSKYMASILENYYKIKQRKTQDIEFKFPFYRISNELIRHFIRGFFDGDGHISFSEINRQFTLSFYSTSKEFLIQIGDIINLKFVVESIIDSSIKSNITLYSLRFNSFNKRRQFIEKLHNWLYQDSKFYLKRKKDKFESYLNTVLTKKVISLSSVERRS